MSRRAFSVAVYARHQDKTLVIHHHRLKTWLPIGGEIEEGETPLEAAKRELKEETGLDGAFKELTGAHDGVPAGLIGYEEHQAGSKGLHMNFVFVCWIGDPSKVQPNDEFSEFRWITKGDFETLEAPLNVKQFGYDALAATPR